MPTEELVETPEAPQPLALTPLITLTATLDQLTGVDDVLGALRITLKHFGNWVPRIVGTSLVVKIQYFVRQPAGVPISIPIWGNDQITPNGTYYMIEGIDSRGNVNWCGFYVLTGSGSQDLSSLPQYDPITQPVPPLPPEIDVELLTILASNDMVFPGGEYTAFYTQLTGDVLLPTIQDMVPGNLYTFIIQQDATGNHQFVWPTNVFNGNTIYNLPSWLTFQTFVCTSTGTLYAIAPATYGQ